MWSLLLATVAVNLLPRQLAAIAVKMPFIAYVEDSSSSGSCSSSLQLLIRDLSF